MHNHIFLDGDRIFLRPLETDDIGGNYLEGINSQVLDIYTEHAQFPHNKFNLVEYAESKWKSGDIWLGIFLKPDNKHIGNIELSDIDYIHSKAKFQIILWLEHKNGHAFEAGKLLISFAFGKLNMNRIELGVNENNLPAIKLYKKLGFQQEGVLREAFIRNAEKSNSIAMGLLRNDFHTNNH